MAGRLTPPAGRRLPISRASFVALVAASVIGSSQAVAAEWTVQAGPTGTTAAQASATPGDGTWTVAPSEGTWSVATGEPVPEVIDNSPQGILDAFIMSSLESSPPVPPTAVDPGLPTTSTGPTVTLPPDAPEVIALAEAQDALETLEAELADVRGRIEEAGSPTPDGLRDRATTLEGQVSEAAVRVEELRPAVEELRERLEAEAAAAAPTTPTPASPFSTLPGLTFAPVTATVPVIDANLASNLDAYLSSKGSPLAGLGAVFVYQSTAVGLDPRLLVAISGAETSFGQYGPSQRIHNPFGMGPGIVYPTWEDSIAAAARNLGGRLYKGSGLVTIAQIQRRWAPNGAANDPTNLNSHWFKNVSQYYRELGGDPNGGVFTDKRPSTAIPVAPGVAPGIQGTVAAPVAYGGGTAVPGGGTNKGPAAVQLAVKLIGTPYVTGAADPKVGFDFSGLVSYVYARQGVTVPRTAEAQAAVGTPLAPEQLTAGDVVFFADRAGRIHHEGLYIGEGYFVHALPQRGGQVMISALSEPFYATQYAGARRY